MKMFAYFQFLGKDLCLHVVHAQGEGDRKWLKMAYVMYEWPFSDCLNWMDQFDEFLERFSRRFVQKMD